MPNGFADVSFEGRSIRLEHAWLNGDRRDAPLIVFLHEALGTIAMWRDFPQRLCNAGGFRGLLYSRYGHGGSTARPPREPWPLDYLEREARLLPEFLHAVGATVKPWLFGHSDGASIALIHAATFPDSLAGAVVLAPHIFVEDATIAGVVAARRSYETTDLRRRLGRYHPDPDDAFWRWHDRWVDPQFRGWNIEAVISSIRCPLLAIQGEDDEYATMRQIDAFAETVPGTQLLKLAACGHSPQRDQEAAVLAALAGFVAGLPA